MKFELSIQNFFLSIRVFTIKWVVRVVFPSSLSQNTHCDSFDFVVPNNNVGQAAFILLYNWTEFETLLFLNLLIIILLGLVKCFGIPLFALPDAGLGFRHCWFSSLRLRSLRIPPHLSWKISLRFNIWIVFGYRFPIHIVWSIWNIIWLKHLQ